MFGVVDESGKWIPPEGASRILKQEILKTKMVWLFLLGIKYHIRHDLAQRDKEIYVGYIKKYFIIEEEREKENEVAYNENYGLI